MRFLRRVVGYNFMDQKRNEDIQQELRTFNINRKIT